MLDLDDFLWLLNDIPSGYIDPNDPFFHPGNASFLVQYRKLGVITDKDNEEIVHREQQPVAVCCNVYRCNKVFENVTDYQMHFNLSHRYWCAFCKRTLPTAHLLHLHVSEAHDSYFAARVDRGEPMFECFLEECKEKMLTSKDRKTHSVQVHKFPTNYRYDESTTMMKHMSSKKKYKCPPRMKAINSKPEEPGVEPMDITTDNIQQPVRTPKSFTFGLAKQRVFRTKNNKEINMNDLKKELNNI